jgi:hypothetical protein
MAETKSKVTSADLLDIVPLFFPPLYLVDQHWFIRRFSPEILGTHKPKKALLIAGLFEIISD